MKKRINGIFLCALLILLPTIIMELENDPKIMNESGDARACLDIVKVWFCEDQDNFPVIDMNIELRNPSSFSPKQYFALLWIMNDEYYYSMIDIGILLIIGLNLSLL